MYQTPKACYRKASIRRETAVESATRMNDQVPPVRIMIELLHIAEEFTTKKRGFTINKGLVKGKPMYYKDVTSV